MLPIYSVTLNDDGATNVDGLNTRPAAADIDGTTNRDLVYVATAAAGRSITFTNTVWNRGNSSDTFNISVAQLAAAAGLAAWPAGTTIDLLKPGGAALVDTNNDGVVDTGPIAAAGSYAIVVRVNLPSNAPASALPSDVEVTATSASDKTATPNLTYDRLGAITAPSVDLANSLIILDAATNADPVASGPTQTATPASTYSGPVAFDLYVANEAAAGTPSDTYTLQYSNTNATPFAVSVMSAGWSVEFRTEPSVGASCFTAGDTNRVPLSGGSPISSITLAPQNQSHYCAIVTPPSDRLAATENVFFRVVSSASGASDVKQDQVIIGANNSLQIILNNTGQTVPGGTVVYPHTVKNTGNTSCTNQFSFTINTPVPGWTYTLYWDKNNDGVIDAGDTPLNTGATVNTITALTSAGTATDQFKILVKVFAPGGASSGATDTATISTTGNCGSTSTTSNNALDTTTVVTGDVRVRKSQALDITCTAALSTLTFGTTRVTAKPGECIAYQVVAVNEGRSDVTTLVLSDTTPAFTGYAHTAAWTCSAGSTKDAVSTALGAGDEPSGTANGKQPVTESCSIATLTPGASVTLTMKVQVNKF